MSFPEGLIPLTPEQKKVEEKLIAGAAPYSIEYAGMAGGDMPVLGWSTEFEKKLEERSALREKYEAAGLSLDPWDILNALPNDRRRSFVYSWNQGNRPSCSCHAAAHAFQASELIAIGLGSPLIYEAINPIYSFYLAKHGSYSGGLDMLTLANEINSRGMFPASLVGTDNISVTAKGLTYEKKASEHQAGLIRIEDNLPERIWKVCKGLGSICFGAGVFFTSAEKDANGVRVMKNTSYGGHAQAFSGSREVNGTGYIWNQNSHGPLYGEIGPDAEPVTGAWITQEILQRYCRDMANYGSPLVIFCEGEYTEAMLTNTFKLPRRQVRDKRSV